MRPGVSNLGVCERINCHGGGLVMSGFSSKTGTLELIVCQIFSSILTKIAVKFELLVLDIVLFSTKCLLWRGNVTFLNFQMRIL